MPDALLPTPKTVNRASRRAMVNERQWASPQLEQAVELAQGILPREFESWDEVPGRSGRLLPTPDAAVFNDGQTVEAWQERRQREIAKGYNGNGGGTPLAMFVRLLPTPTARDHKDTGDLSNVPENSLLPRVIDRLLPTPRTSDSNGAGEHGDGGPDLRTTVASLGESSPPPSTDGKPSPDRPHHHQPTLEGD